MIKDFTLAIIKPDAIKKNYIIPILNKIDKKGFKIKGIKMLSLSKKRAEEFYIIHKERPFFESLTIFMSSNPILVMVLEKENAIIDFRTLIGITDPKKADENTIRKIYGESIEKNAIHGSDSIENAIKEISFYFILNELFIRNKKLFIF